MVTITNMINYNLVHHTPTTLNSMVCNGHTSTRLFFGLFLKKNADVHRYIMMYDA